MRLAILGGTFDPIHVAHLAVAEAVRDVFQLDRMLLLTARRPPHKGEREVTTFSHRLAMTALACRGRDRLEPSDYEGSRPGPSYTVETVRHFRGELEPDDPLFFVMGSDSLADLPSWREPRRILALANLVVAPRPGTAREVAEGALGADLAARVSAASGEAAPACGSIYWTEVPQQDVSGSEIRRRVRADQGIAGLVPEAVAEYIARYHLYGGPEDPAPSR